MVAAVHKSYGSVHPLRNVEFSVAAGAFFGLVGVNGAGKTTLIKCLLDAIRPDSGEIRIFGESSRKTQSRRQLAFLPERFSAPYYVTGLEFLVLMSRLYRVRSTSVAVDATVRSLDLDPDALCRPVKSYSKGMTQKLGLAACLLSERPLLVLDEPASGLDPKARALLKVALRASRSKGTTVFLTSHALADVEEMCDSMAVLHGGALRYIGTPGGLRTVTGQDSLESAFLATID
ncbi:MAG: ABC transporter ATP-binding protein [Betaproteobacteria bacterium]|nr:ABC transporter ATP-binding protein [Betaproteobacteria bacterium]